MPKHIDDINLTITSNQSLVNEDSIHLFPYDKESVFIRVETHKETVSHDTTLRLPIRMLQQLSTRLPVFLDAIQNAEEGNDESRVKA